MLFRSVGLTEIYTPDAAMALNARGDALRDRLNALCRALAVELARYGVTANAILPGWIDTALTRRAREQVSGLHESVLKRTPAARWGVPDDFAGIAVFLAAAASDFVTGAAIYVDGGRTAQ